MGLIVFTPWVMPESGRWLMSMGEGEKVVGIIKKIAKLNGKEVPPSVFASVLARCERQKLENGNKAAPSYLDLFKTPAMRKITILLTILMMLVPLEFDCTVRNISN